MSWTFLWDRSGLYGISFPISEAFGLWKDFYNDFSVGVTWWINETHGVAIDYDYTFNHEIDYLSLNYFYSWR